jgi:hypothetical protein
MRLRQYAARQPCYYCGTPGPSSREHAPPKLIFANFDCDHITVPSCDTHNNAKSDKDRAIVTWLIKSLDRMFESGVSTTSTSPIVIEAISHLKPSFGQAAKHVSDNSFLSDPELDFKIPAIDFDFSEWIRQLSAALIWSVTGQFDDSIKWNEAYVSNEFYLQGPDTRPLSSVLSELLFSWIGTRHIESFDWKPGWSARPRAYPRELYNFSVCFSPTLVQEIEREVAFRHQFYATLDFYVWFVPSVSTWESLKEAAA